MTDAVWTTSSFMDEPSTPAFYLLPVPVHVIFKYVLYNFTASRALLDLTLF